MKNKFIALAMGVVLAGCQQAENEGAKDAVEKTPTAKAQADAGLAEADKMAYALGVDMANSINRISTDFKALAMDGSMVQKGFADAMAGQPLLTEEEIEQQKMIFQQKFSFAQQQKMQEAMAQAEKDNADFLTQKETEGYTKTDSGLLYKVVENAGDEAKLPEATDKVRVHYTGTLIDGTVFDSSLERDQPFEFSLTGGVIQGWLEGVKLMPVGSKYQFVIPPELAYGPRPVGQIPANSVLVFDVELLDIIEEEKTADGQDK